MVPRRAILFDWDGTIVDSVPALFETDSLICRTLGIPLDREIYKRAFSPNWRRKYQALGIPDEQVQLAVAIWSETFHSGATTAFPGIEQALAQLSSRGYVLGVVTSGSRSEIEPQFERLGLEELLTIGVFGDDPVEGKPDPAPLLLALERAGGVDPERATYVGDALDDVRMAAAAGVRGIGIVSLLATAEELAAAGASQCAGSVAAWVESLLGSAGGRETPEPEP
jgi:phosphoglycolate phosphatase